MISSLSISNYALIRKLEIDFSPGFSVITGETGAGKSILLGALSLLLGKRADTTVLSGKDEKCVVEGTFKIGKLDLAKFFEQHDLDYDENTLIRREILPSGRSRAFINDTPVSLQILKTMTDRLVDIHSQHETLLMGDGDFQLQAIDSYAGLGELREKYEQAFQLYRQVEKRLEKLKAEMENALRERDYHQFLFDELEAVRLDAKEFEKLQEREKFLTHAEEVIQVISGINQLMNEEERHLPGMLGEVVSGLSTISDFHGDAEQLLERFRSVKIEIDDLAMEISRLHNAFEYDPAELEQVNDRLNEIYNLQQKHHVTSVEALITIREELQSNLAKINRNEDEEAELEKQLTKQKELAWQLAGQLSEQRKKSAKSFSEKVKSSLSELGMEAATFKVNVEQLESLRPYGMDKLKFLFNANRGGKPEPIDRIASGGELSRLMLAIKSLITREKLLPTIIFDEIDAGVSGDIAAKVGRIMQKMSSHHQLIAISHLPQIAAKADHHYKVFKLQEEDITATMINKLDDEGRVEEIAKLLSDEKISHAARSTAKELLK